MVINSINICLNYNKNKLSFMVEIKLSERLREHFPDIKIGILEVRNLINKKFDYRLEKEKRKLESFIREKYINVEDLDVIKKYTQFFKKFEKSYPIEFQIKSMLRGKNIPTVSSVVEAMFMAELKNMFLTAGHDLDAIKGNLETKITSGGEKYVKINLKEQQLKPEDIITTDEIGIISSVLYGPDHRTRITENTKNYLFFSYFPYGEDDTKINQHFMGILNNIRIFLDKELEFSEAKIFQL